MLKWFNSLPDKNLCSFITFDVCEFYPSITPDLLEDALDFASNYVHISIEQRKIIMHTKKSILFKSDETWVKKNTDNIFDVTMGSYDGAETCELVGTYILYQITKKHGKNFGLYRDDGLGIIRGTPRQIELIKKDLCAIFHRNKLKITVEANMKIINFLDVTLDLNTGYHMPFTKPNHIPKYVNCKSNHPPNILKNIPISINKRLSELSSNVAVFNRAVPIYQTALQQSGYKHQLQFQETHAVPPKTRRRHRDICWYNPPFSKNVITNIGKAFFRIIDREFPAHHKLAKIFNRNTIKMSYSTMTNIKQAISAHNSKILSNEETTTNKAGCNCRDKTLCPLIGNCLANSVIYQATVTTNNVTKPAQTYVGLTEGTFKKRYSNHKHTFNNTDKRTSTELSAYIWKLKDNNITFSIKWKILAHAKAYTNISRYCNLCTTEKYFIIFHKNLASLNTRNELISTCRHASKYLIK